MTEPQPVTIRSLDPVAVMHVAANMRTADALEVYATRWPIGGRSGPDNPAQVAADVIACSRFGAVAWWGIRPVAALGAAELWPHVWSLWMFATPDWPHVARATTRWCRGVLQPRLLQAGGVRAQAYVVDWYRPARAWLERFGFTAEATLPHWGRAGETFVLMSWIRGRSDVRIRQPEASTAAAGATASTPAGPDQDDGRGR